jgi:hypothetical protein
METITTALTTGFTGISTDAMGIIAVIVPIAIGIAGAIFVIKKALSWFKGLAK